MGMFRRTKGLLVAGVLVACSAGPLFAKSSNMALLDQLDGATVTLRDSTGKYLTVDVNDANLTYMKAQTVNKEQCTPHSVFFTAYRTTAGAFGLKSLVNNKFLQIDQVYARQGWAHRLLRAEGGAFGAWEAFALVGDSFDKVSLWYGDDCITDGPRIVWNLVWFNNVASSRLPGPLWSPRGDERAEGKNLGVVVKDEPVYFTLEIIKESPAVIEAKRIAKEEARQKALDEFILKQQKDEELAKKSADELKAANKALEEKLEAQKREIAEREKELKHAAEVMASGDKGKLKELGEALNKNVEVAAQVEEAKKEEKAEEVKQKVEQATPEQVEKAKEAVEVEHVKAKAEAEKARTEVKAKSVKAKAKAPAKKVAPKKAKTAKKVAAKPTRKVAAKRGRAISRDKAGRPAGKKKPAKKTIRRKVSAKKPAKVKRPVKAKVPTKAKAPTKAPVKAVATAPEETDGQETDIE
ncbi:MAG: hypothetical protein ABH827_04760 [bacterium]